MRQAHLSRPRRPGPAWRAVSALLVVLAAATVAPTAGCQQVDTRITGQIRIATGSSAAVYYRYGVAYRDLIHRLLPRIEPSVLTTAASAANVAMVEQGDAQVGFTQADIVTLARPGSLAALARIYDDHLHLVVRAEDSFTNLPALRGRRVSIGETGSGTEVTALRLLTVAGIAPDRGLTASRLGLDASVTALQTGLIDAFFFSGGLPVAAIAGLAANRPIRLIGLREYVAPLRRAFGDHYTERVVPSSAYHAPPVVTIGIPNYLVVAGTMSDAMAYALTWALFTGRERITRAHPVGASLGHRTAIGTPPLPLHPGAARYYRAAKI